METENRQESWTDKASQVGQTAENKIDEQKDKAASKLESAAAKLHETADTSSERMSNMAHSAAEGLQSTASFLREHDTREMVGSLEGVIRKYPAQSLLIAVATGFLLGRALKND